MVDRAVERDTEEKREIYIQGRDKPDDRPGYVARPVKGRDPTKDPNEISGWKLVPLTGKENDEPPFLIPPELRSDGANATQNDFMDIVENSQEGDENP